MTVLCTAKVDLLDTAGQEDYDSLLPISVKGSNAVIMVFATDDNLSFSSIDAWKTKILSSGIDQETILVLNGNKCDLNRFSDYDMNELASYGGYNLFFQTSARTGENVNRMFDETIDLVNERYGRRLPTSGLRIGDDGQKQQRKRCSCK
ncbi:ras-related protein Rab-5A-like isoform X2 [Convolutriloba macropyga]|uniref:ras-related protein Rab-5A-like isoform X2 n=1 Tax=Convolutriloba macropyga TaxID=536237 RepID=UPI003F51AF64